MHHRLCAERIGQPPLRYHAMRGAALLPAPLGKGKCLQTAQTHLVVGVSESPARRSIRRGGFGRQPGPAPLATTLKRARAPSCERAAQRLACFARHPTQGYDTQKNCTRMHERMAPGQRRIAARPAPTKASTRGCCPHATTPKPYAEPQHHARAAFGRMRSGKRCRAASSVSCRARCCADATSGVMASGRR